MLNGWLPCMGFGRGGEEGGLFVIFGFLAPTKLRNESRLDEKIAGAF